MYDGVAVKTKFASCTFIGSDRVVSFQVHLSLFRIIHSANAPQQIKYTKYRVIYWNRYQIMNSQTVLEYNLHIIQLDSCGTFMLFIFTETHYCMITFLSNGHQMINEEFNTFCGA